MHESSASRTSTLTARSLAPARRTARPNTCVRLWMMLVSWQPGKVPVRMWQSPGADVAKSRCGCVRVPCARRTSSGASCSAGASGGGNWQYCSRNAYRSASHSRGRCTSCCKYACCATRYRWCATFGSSRLTGTTAAGGALSSSGGVGMIGRSVLAMLYWRCGSASLDLAVVVAGVVRPSGAMDGCKGWD